MRPTTDVIEPEAPTPLRARLTTNFTYLLLGRIAAQGLQFFATIYLARVLLPEAFGRVGFALSAVSYFMVLSDMGLLLLGAREVSAERGQPSELSEIVSLRFALGVFSFLLLGIICLSQVSYGQTTILALLFGLAIIPNSLTLDWLFLGKERTKGVALVNTARGLIYVGLLAMWVKGPANLLRVPFFYLMGYLVAAYVSWQLAFSWKLSSSLRLGTYWRAWKPLLASSVPIFGYAVLNSSYQTVTVLLLGWLRNPEQVAIYVAAYRPILVAVYVVQEFGFSMLPVLSSRRAAISERGSQLVVSVGKICVGGGIFIAILAHFVAAPLVNLLYGPLYRDAALQLEILMWSLPALATIYLFAMDFIAGGKMRPVLEALTLGLSVQVSASLGFIPRYGATAASSGYLAGMIVAALYMSFRHRAFRGRRREAGGGI